MESRIRESIHAFKGESAWSPMPEHLLFTQVDKEKSPTPIATEGEQICEECGMKFKSEAMLTYHKVGFCVGPSTDELFLEEIPTESSFVLPGESRDIPTNMTNAIQHSAKNTKLTSSSRVIKQDPPKLEWCMCAHGAVAPAAIKVGYDDSDQTYTYLCVAQVGEEVIPGTVLPPRKHATVLFRGSEIKATDYSVLTDLVGLATWKRCDTAGSIPRGAVRGGYDSDELQYFIGRGKAPDGNWCCGQYLPHKQQCCFAWEGNEYKTKEFEILCKTTPKQYFSKAEINVKKSTDTTIAKPMQTTVNIPKDIEQDKTLTHDFTRKQKSSTQISMHTDSVNNINEHDTSVILETGRLTNRNESAKNPKRQDTGILSLGKPRQKSTSEMVKSGTEVKSQGKITPTYSKENISKENSRIVTPRELTKSRASTRNDHSKDKSKNFYTRELTKPGTLKEQTVSKENSKIVNQRELTKTSVSKEQVSKEKSKIVSQRELTTSGASKEQVSNVKEKSKIVNKKELTIPIAPNEQLSKEKSKVVSQRELTTPRTSNGNSEIVNKRELTKSGTIVDSKDTDQNRPNTGNVTGNTNLQF